MTGGHAPAKSPEHGWTVRERAARPWKKRIRRRAGGRVFRTFFRRVRASAAKQKKPLRTGLRAGAGAFLHGIPCALLRCFPGRMGADGALPAQRHAGCFPCARGFYADRVTINWRNAFRACRCFLYGEPCVQLHTASGNASALMRTVSGGRRLPLRPAPLEGHDAVGIGQNVRPVGNAEDGQALLFLKRLQHAGDFLLRFFIQI